MTLNKYLPFAILLTIPTAMSAAEPMTAQPDTVFTVKNASTVILSESPKGIELSVRGTENDPDFKSTIVYEYEPNVVVKSRQGTGIPLRLRRQRSRNDVSLFGGFHAGFCGTVGAPASLGVEMAKSFELGIDNLINYEHFFPGDRSAIIIGMGINWRNYRMTGNECFIMNDGVITVGDYPEGSSGRYSRLKIFSLSFPIQFRYEFPVKMICGYPLAVRFGAILNWNSHGSLRTGWTEADGTEAEYNTDYIGHRKFSVDIMGAVKLAPYTGLYMKYSPMKFFKSGRGPEFSTISTGIYFMF